MEEKGVYIVGASKNKEPRIWDLDQAFHNVWRVYVETPDIYGGEESTIFVEALHKEEAQSAVLKVVSAIYPDMSDIDIENSIYNLWSARELIENGDSESLVQRLFESGIRSTADGWAVIAWCKAPVFAVKHPSALFQAWSEAVAHFEKNRVQDRGKDERL